MNIEIEIQDGMREITQRFQLVQDAAGLTVPVPAARIGVACVGGPTAR